MSSIQDKQPEIIKNFRQCYMRGCLAMGWWEPNISISPDGIQRAHLNFAHILVCDYHKTVIGIEDLVDGPTSSGVGAFERIQQAFAKGGKDVPLREFTKLNWRPG